jgi:hypothetical protein
MYEERETGTSVRKKMLSLGRRTYLIEIWDLLALAWGQIRDLLPCRF